MSTDDLEQSEREFADDFSTGLSESSLRAPKSMKEKVLISLPSFSALWASGRHIGFFVFAIVILNKYGAFLFGIWLYIILMVPTLAIKLPSNIAVVTVAKDPKARLAVFY